jgi:hypothetical protein
MGRLLPLALIAALAACSKSGDSNAPSPAAGASGSSAHAAASASAASAAATAESAGGGSLDLHCDKLVPADVRAKYFSGMELKESGRSPHDCLFAAPGIEGASKQVSIGYRCTQGFSDAQVTSGLAGLRVSDKAAKDIPGLGRAALELTFLGNRQIHVYDDKTPCAVTLGFGRPPPANTQEIARAVMAALTPAAIGK